MTKIRFLDTDTTIAVIAQTCRGLTKAHASSIVHRDLKPENIFLVARDGKAVFVKVLDFGIARSLSSRGSRRLTNPGIAMGTPEYMAPEQASGGVVDARSDIYSVGTLLYEMLTGMPPHAGAPDVMTSRARDRPRPPREIQPDISGELERVILRALEPSPEERYQTMAQLEYDLTKSLLGRPRAVADLLGLREEERESDTESVAKTSSERIPRVTEPAAAPAVAAVATEGTPHGVVLAPPVRSLLDEGPAPARRGRAALRFWGTLALLTVAALAAVAAYRRLPWTRLPERAVAAPPSAAALAAQAETRRHAEQAQALIAELEGMLSKPPALEFAAVPRLEDRLASLRREGGGAAADRLSARAADALVRVATGELDAGAMEAGVSHYKIALSVDPKARGQSELAQTLRGRGERALAARRPSEAVRWARAALSLAEADPDAHALLGASLLAVREYGAAAAEYGKALASRPDDAAFKRGLARARRKLDAATTGGRAPGEGAEPEAPVPAPAGSPTEENAPPPAPPAPSAPGEAAPEQQQ